MSWAVNDRMLEILSRRGAWGLGEEGTKTLNVAASAVSRRIIEMETAVGQALLERGPRGVVPTEAGRAVAKHPQRQADEMIVLEDRLRRLQGVQEGTVRICCGGGFLADLLDQGLIGFAADDLGVTFKFKVTLGTTGGILAAVAQGEANIGMANTKSLRS